MRKSNLAVCALGTALSFTLALGGVLPASASAEEANMQEEALLADSVARVEQPLVGDSAPQGEIGVRGMTSGEPADTLAAPLEDESGSTGLTAQAWYGLPLDGSWVEGSITESVRGNFYKVTLTKPGKLKVTYQDMGIFRSNVYMFNEDQSVEYWHDRADSATASKPVTVYGEGYYDAGTYYVQITDAGFSSVTGPYRLRATFSPVDSLDKEPNNESGNATALAAGTKVRGLFTFQDRTDMYRINVRTNATIRFTTENPDGDLPGIGHLYIYDGNMARVYDTESWRRIGIDGPSYSDTVQLSAGTYYIQLDRYRFPTTDSSCFEWGGPYTLKWNYSFPDVPTTHWGSDVISGAVDRGLFLGYSNGNFGPDDPITRGQAAVVLWNMAGKPVSYSGKDFPDVKSGDYYYRAVRWASAVGVVNGYKDGTFGPTKKITREEFAVMLANYTRRVARKTVSGSASDYSGMHDRANVSAYARFAVGWCFRNQILTGSNGAIRPKDSTNRAEVAKMVTKVYDITR